MPKTDQNYTDTKENSKRNKTGKKRDTINIFFFKFKQILQHYSNEEMAVMLEFQD
jgi:hypothetical protein